jgi:DNA-directed RNA polymerase specialized sigma24 family protein
MPGSLIECKAPNVGAPPAAATVPDPLPAASEGDEMGHMSLVRTRAEVEKAVSRVARLEELYVRNAPSALRTAYFLTGDADLAEDLVQEAFVRIAGRFGHLRTPEAFPAYLRRTIVNLFTSHLRRRALERCTAPPSGQPAPDVPGRTRNQRQPLARARRPSSAPARGHRAALLRGSG